jgi:hypothetical protein
MNGCFKDPTDTLFMGVRIMENQSVIADWHFPFEVAVAKGKIIFRKEDGFIKVYKIADFDQSEAELKDILLRCANGTYGTELFPRTVTYTVNAGDQSQFLIPIASDETQILDPNYYTVFVDATTADVGTDEFEWILQDGDVFFTVPIPDNTPGEDPYDITIKYWVRK